jgi:hypothetical protein
MMVIEGSVPPLVTSLRFEVTLTLLASLVLIAAILWLGVNHSNPEVRQKRAASILLQKKLAPRVQRWKHRKVQNNAARSIQLSWRSKRSLVEKARELSAPTMLSLFGGYDPYHVAAVAASSSSSSSYSKKMVPMPHIEYRPMDDESTESSSLPDLIYDKATSRKLSFHGIFLAVTLLVLLSRCIFVSDDPWTHVVPMQFIGQQFATEKSLPSRSSATTTTESCVVPAGEVARTRWQKNQGTCDRNECNSYAKTLGGAYGPFVPF